MAKCNAEIRLLTLSRKAVWYRDGWCRSCGESYHEAHHLIPLAQGNWRAQFDLDYMIGLCAGCHRLGPIAPHKSPSGFVKHMLPRLLQGMSPIRAAKVDAAMGKACPIATDRPNWKEETARVKKLLAGYKDDYECAGDIVGRRM